jgi:hypothetical protein
MTPGLFRSIKNNGRILRLVNLLNSPHKISNDQATTHKK